MIRTIAVAAIAAGTIATVGGVASADGQDKIAFCHNDNNLHVIETSVQAFFNAGHVDHEGDIWAAFDYTENGKDGQLVHVPAQGDQAVLANGCLPLTPTESPSPSSSPSPSDIPSSPPVTQTPSPSVTSPSPSDTPTIPEKPVPVVDEDRVESPVDCDNLTITVTITTTITDWVWNGDEWVLGEPGEPTVSSYVVDANPNECPSESPSPSDSPSASVTPTAHSTSSPSAPSVPDETVTPVPVNAELAHTGADLTPLWLGLAAVLGSIPLILMGRRRQSTPPAHR